MTMAIEEQLAAVMKSVSEIPDDKFTAYPGGWPNEISTALVDAVYSIMAKYTAADSTKGVEGRLRTFRQTYPQVLNDLQFLVDLGEAPIREVMGNGKVGRSDIRHKSVAIIEAATNFLAMEPPVRTSSSFLVADQAKLKREYCAVHGLGWVTFEYLCMNLGVPGVKADTMIVRFINEALAKKGLPSVSPTEARELTVAAHEASGRSEGLTNFDHAIWLTESERVNDPDN